MKELWFNFLYGSSVRIAGGGFFHHKFPSFFLISVLFLFSPIIRGFSSLSFTYCARFFELIRSQIGRPVAAAAAAVEDATETGTTGPEDPGQLVIFLGIRYCVVVHFTYGSSSNWA